MDIGEKLKNYRLRMGLTQEELAERSDLTKGFISQLEHDQTSPSLDTLEGILNALGMTFVDFFSEKEEEQIVFHSADAVRFIHEENSHIIHWIVPNAQSCQMEPVLIEIMEGGRSKEYSPFEGEVFGYVLQGNALLHYGDSPLKIGKNDSFYFEANEPFWLENSNKKAFKAVWVVTPPIF